MNEVKVFSFYITISNGDRSISIKRFGREDDMSFYEFVRSIPGDVLNEMGFWKENHGKEIQAERT